MRADLKPAINLSLFNLNMFKRFTKANIPMDLALDPTPSTTGPGAGTSISGAGSQPSLTTSQVIAPQEVQSNATTSMTGPGATGSGESRLNPSTSEEIKLEEVRSDYIIPTPTSTGSRKSRVRKVSLF